ncbi:hypothetical protein [Stappia sp. MMSF_3263]|uniref:hypothetical protein n=1 Tax=Stappia sp. MMSF_3263 TaxID=3046693 RepID=UPI00273ED282|nr:hypothetical protein [Stappia sp. MMSF_3263]
MSAANEQQRQPVARPSIGFTQASTVPIRVGQLLRHGERAPISTANDDMDQQEWVGDRAFHAARCPRGSKRSDEYSKDCYEILRYRAIRVLNSCQLMKCFLPITLSLLIFDLIPRHASANPFEGITVQEANPIESDPLRDYRIYGCKGVSGTGWYRYHTGNDPSVIDYVLSDFCLDTQTGDFFSKESLSGLTHVLGPRSVEPGSTASAYEDLDESGDVVSGVYIQTLPAPLQCSSNTSGTFSIQAMLSEQRVESGPLHFTGLSNGIPYPHGRTIPPDVDFGLRILAISTIDNKRIKSEELFPLGLGAEADAEEGSQTIKITVGDQTTVGEASGSLQVSFEDDRTFVLSGEIQAKSPRVIGIKPNEFASLSIRIEYMRGTTAGKRGEGTYAAGIARGAYIDGSGETHALRFKIGLTACTAKPGLPADFF